MSKVRAASDTALLVETADLDEAMRLHLALVAAQLDGVRELVPAAQTILVHFDRRVVGTRELARAISGVRPVDKRTGGDRTVTVPVRYDGEDLGEVAALLNVSTLELMERHSRARWQVAFTGFAPGFGYLVCDDPLFRVPRRASPRTKIPAGSLALAGEFTGVYPRESPGGWQLIGTTDAVMWDLTREPPALFTPGTNVQFAVTKERITIPSTSPEASKERVSLEVVRSGLQLLVQDAGRGGFADLGVSASGVADRSAMRIANQAVGNHNGAAVLECAGGGAVFRVHESSVAAIAGADVTVEVRGAQGTYVFERHSPFALEPGDELRLGQATSGWRAVIAFRGGVAVPSVLGSAATDTLAGLGPAPLQTGDTLTCGRPDHAIPVEPGLLPPSPLPSAGESIVLDIVWGPRNDWLTSEGRATLVTQAWTVTSTSDRVGMRLDGDERLARREGELPSEGAVTGALQVPPDGRPVLFLQDHPLTGGYPIVAAVASWHLDVAAQLPPGSMIQFRPVQEAL